MSDSQTPTNGNMTRAALGALVGAAIGGASYVALGHASDQLPSLFAVLVGLPCGVGARLGAGRRSMAAGLVGALLAGLAAVVANVALAGSFPAAVEISFLIKNFAIAGVAAAIVGHGSRLTESIVTVFSRGGGGIGGGGARSGDQRGLLECPTCGSVQTEPQDVARGGIPGGYVCNACDKRWSP